MRKHVKILAVFAVVLCSACAYGSSQDKVARFYMPGPNRCADGSVVRDGEANTEIALSTAQSAKRRFFKVKRVE